MSYVIGSLPLTAVIISAFGAVIILVVLTIVVVLVIVVYKRKYWYSLERNVAYSNENIIYEEISNITRRNDDMERRGDSVIPFHHQGMSGHSHSDANGNDQDSRNSLTFSNHDYELYDQSCSFISAES